MQLIEDEFNCELEHVCLNSISNMTSFREARARLKAFSSVIGPQGLTSGTCLPLTRFKGGLKS